VKRRTLLAGLAAVAVTPVSALTAQPHLTLEAMRGVIAELQPHMTPAPVDWFQQGWDEEGEAIAAEEIERQRMWEENTSRFRRVTALRQAGHSWEQIAALRRIGC
jgi:hypothetical protein